MDALETKSNNLVLDTALLKLQGQLVGLHIGLVREADCLSLPQAGIEPPEDGDETIDESLASFKYIFSSFGHDHLVDRQIICVCQGVLALEQGIALLKRLAVSVFLIEIIGVVLGDNHIEEAPPLVTAAQYQLLVCRRHEHQRNEPDML